MKVFVGVYYVFTHSHEFKPDTYLFEGSLKINLFLSMCFYVSRVTITILVYTPVVYPLRETFLLTSYTKPHLLTTNFLGI